MTMQIRLLKKDILIKPKDINEVVESIIHIHKSDEQQEKVNYFEVLEVSPEVTLVNKGDTILLEYLQHTMPLIINDVRCAVTSEDDVIAVIEP